MNHRSTKILKASAFTLAALVLVPTAYVVAQPESLPEWAKAYGARDKFTTADREPVTMGVIVTKTTDENDTTPVPGADVKVYRFHKDGRHYGARLVAQGTTDENGVALFELPRGAYGIRATDGELHGHAKVRLHEDQRVPIHLGADDRERPHQNGPHAVGIWAFYRSEDGAKPAANAHVAMAQCERTDTGNVTCGPVREGTTDERGIFTAVLPAGAYCVRVSDGELAGHRCFLVNHDKWVRLGLTDDAEDPEPEPSFDRPMDARAQMLRRQHAARADANDESLTHAAALSVRMKARLAANGDATANASS